MCNDNTVVWGGRRLQLPESRLRPHFVRTKVQVRSYPDGTIAIDLGAAPAGTLQQPMCGSGRRNGPQAEQRN